MNIFQSFIHKALVVISSFFIAASSLTTSPKISPTPRPILPKGEKFSLSSPKPNLIFKKKTSINKSSSNPKKILKKVNKPVSVNKPFYITKPTPSPTVPVSTPLPTLLPSPIPTSSPTSSSTPPQTLSSSVLLLKFNRCPENVTRVFKTDHDFMLTYKMKAGNQINVKIESGSLELLNQTLKGDSGVLATLPHGEKYTIILKSKKCSSYQNNSDWFWLYYKNLN